MPDTEIESKTYGISITPKEPVADFVCKECGYILAPVYLDANDKTVICSWCGPVSINSYQADLKCPSCGRQKRFYSGHKSAINLGAVKYD